MPRKSADGVSWRELPRDDVVGEHRVAVVAARWITSGGLINVQYPAGVDVVRRQPIELSLFGRRLRPEQAVLIGKSPANHRRRAPMADRLNYQPNPAPTGATASSGDGRGSTVDKAAGINTNTG